MCMAQSGILSGHAIVQRDPALIKYTTGLEKEMYPLSCSGFIVTKRDGGICLAAQSTNVYMGLHDTDHLQCAC
jgi:hypothetical protein